MARYLAKCVFPRQEMCQDSQGWEMKERKKIVFSKRITAVVSLRLHICLTTCDNWFRKSILKRIRFTQLKNVLCKARLCTVQVCNMHVRKS